MIDPANSAQPVYQTLPNQTYPDPVGVPAATEMAQPTALEQNYTPPTLMTRLAVILTNNWPIFGLIFAALIVFSLFSKNSSVPSSLTTAGVGTKKVQADRVKITFTVSLTGAEPSALFDKGENTTAQIMKLVQAMNPESVRKVDARVVPTSAGGFQYVSGAQIELKDFVRIADLQRLLVQNGASVAQITYSISNSQAVEQEVRELAFAKAQEKAQGLAKASQVKLGSVLAVVEQNATNDTGTAVTQAKAADNGTSATQEIELNTSVQVTFGLKSRWWLF